MEPTETTPEKAVLGTVLTSNDTYWIAADIIGPEDFSDPTLGAIFDGIGSLLAQGGRVEAFTLETHFPEWGIRGITADEPWRWVDHANPFLIRGLCERVHSDAIRRRGREVMARGLEELRDPGNDPATVVESVNRGLVEKRESALTTQSLTEILQIPDSENWVVPGLMEKQDRLILTGHEGLGKTTMARQLLILPAAGIHPFTLEKIEPVKALVVDAENTAKQWMRGAKFMANRASQVNRVDAASNIQMMLSGRIDLTNPAKLGSIHRAIDQHKPDVVFAGPLYRLAVQMNTDEHVAPVIAALDSIRDRGVALIIEAHAGHALGPGGVRDVRPRGSSALLGWPEFGYGIRKNTEDPAATNLFDFVAWRGAREVRDWPERLIRGNRELGDWPWVDAGPFGL